MMYQMCDDLIDVTGGVTQERLCFTFPLTYLLDHWDELNGSEVFFLRSMLEKETILNHTDAELLTNLYRNHKENIMMYAKNIFNKKLKMLHNSVVLPEEAKQAMIEVIQKACKPEYWEYSEFRKF